MTEAEWLASYNLKQMVALVPAGASDRRYRLFAVACCFLYWDQIRQKRLRKAVKIAERFAHGEATDADLRGAGWMVCQATQERDVRGGVQAESSRSPSGYFVREVIRASVSEDAASAVRRAVYWPSLGQMEDEAGILRDIFGNPFRPMSLDPSWLTSTVVSLARGIYAERAFDRLPILADALQDASCETADVLGHCRGPGPHVRGCWVVDLLLGKS
jgi:hypothetical protein